MRLVIIIFILISTNLSSQKRIGISVSEGYCHFDKFNNNDYQGVGDLYYAYVLQSEFELYYNIIAKNQFKMNIGLGIANTYYFDSGWLFPIDDKSNSLFSRVNSKIFLRKPSIYFTGNLSLYYIPPLFRKYYSQKIWFQSLDLGIGYKFKNDIYVDLRLVTSISSPFHNERLTYPVGTTLEPYLEFNGIFISMSKSIF